MISHQPAVLARDEAAVLAVFDPERFHSLDDLRAAIDLATDQPDAHLRNSELAALLSDHKSLWPRDKPWTAKPRFAEGVLVLRLRQTQEGDDSPWLRRTATARGFAVLDLVTDLVFARPEEQSRFDGVDWKSPFQLPPSEPEWLRVGAFVKHSKFGKGRILAIGKYKDRPVVLVSFADRDRVLDQEYGVLHMRPMQ